MKKLLIVSLLALSACFSAQAQRTAKGTNLASVDAIYTFSSVGADVAFGIYTLDGYFLAGLNAARRYTTASGLGDTKYDVPYWHLVAEGAYLWRLFGTRRRTFTVNAGAGAFLGFETIDPFESVVDASDGGRLSKRGSAFLYGLQARLQCEVFAFRNIALVPGLRVPVNFNSRVDYFPYEVSLGLRYNF